MLRTFFAIELNDAVRQNAANTIQSLQKHIDEKISWVSSEKLHATLRFLGNTPEDKLPLLIENVEQALKTLKSFEITFNKPTTFPPTKPHIIAITVHLNEALAILARTIESIINQLGFPAETRPFLPHITLGRIRSQGRVILDNSNENSPPAMLVKHIVLFQSKLTKNGSTYTVLKKFIIG